MCSALDSLDMSFDASADLEPRLSELTKALVLRFSSRDGYRLHDGVIPTLSALRSRDISIGVVSNSDPRIESVLADLGVDSVASVVTSWDVGVGKPDRRIWDVAVAKARQSRGEELTMDEVLHVGDDIDE